MNKRLIYFLILLIFSAVLIQFSFQKLHLTVELNNRDLSTLEVLQANAIIPHQLKPAPSYNSLTITNISDAKLVIKKISTQNNNTLLIEDLSISQKWKKNSSRSNRKILVSNHKGDSLFWRGYTSDITILFKCSPLSGEVLINWNGKTIPVNLYSKKAKQKEVKLPSKSRLLYLYLPLSSNNVLLRSQNNKIKIKNVAITFLNNKIYSNNTTHSLNESNYNWEPVSYFKLGVTVIINLFLLLSKCLLYITFFYLIGLPLCLLFFKKLSFYEKLLFPIVTGIAFFVTILSSVTFILNLATKDVFSYFAMILIAVYAILLFYQFKNYRRLKESLIASFIDLTKNKKLEITTLLLIFGISTLGLFITFFPETIEPGWFFGQLLNDTFYYINPAQSLVNTKLFDYDPSIWYFFRFADQVFLSAISQLLDTSVMKLYGTINATFWFLLPITSFCLLNRLNVSFNGCLIGSIFFAIVPIVFSIFSQSYFAHHIFVHLLLYALLYTFFLLDNYQNLTLNQQISFYIGIGVIYAASLAIFPYHFLLPLAFIIIVLINLSKRNTKLVKPLIYTGLSALLWANVNLLLIVNISKNFGRDRLNILAEKFIFPFYDDIYFAYVVTGFQDIYNNSTRFESLINELFPISNTSYLTGLLNNINHFFPPVLLTVTIILLLYLIYSIKKKLNNKFILLLTFFTVNILVIALFFFTGQTYGYGKLIMTNGVVALLLILISIDKFSLSNLPTRRIFVFTFTSAFVFMNCLALIMINSTFYLNRESTILTSSKAQYYSNLTYEDKELLSYLNELKQDDKELTILVNGDLNDIPKNRSKIYFWLIWNGITPNKYIANIRIPDVGIIKRGSNSELIRDPAILRQMLREDKIDYIINLKGHKFKFRNKYELVFENRKCRLFKRKVIAC